MNSARTPVTAHRHTQTLNEKEIASTRTDDWKPPQPFIPLLETTNCRASAREKREKIITKPLFPPFAWFKTATRVIYKKEEKIKREQPSSAAAAADSYAKQILSGSLTDRKDDSPLFSGNTRAGRISITFSTLSRNQKKIQLIFSKVNLFLIS